MNTILKIGYLGEKQVAVLEEMLTRAGQEVLVAIGNEVRWIPARLVSSVPYRTEVPCD